MCLLLAAIDATAEFPLLLLGNRDEFHARASAPATKWHEDARVVGGRDLVAGGSWLAVRDDGRFAAVTNLRTGVPANAPASRGWLVRDFVLGDAAPLTFLENLRADAGDYGPFNLVVGDRADVFAFGSRDRVVLRFTAGVHMVSNGAIGVHWPKTERLQRRFDTLIAENDFSESRLLDLLVDETQPPDAALPDTDIGLDLERLLAPVFIRGERYGTRAGTLCVRRDDGSVILHERRFGPNARTSGEVRWQAVRASGFVEAPD